MYKSTSVLVQKSHYQPFGVPLLSFIKLFYSAPLLLVTVWASVSLFV